jgi:hypothetical protein
MKSWLCASALGTCLFATGGTPAILAQDSAAPKRAEEVTLASLRPGKDTLAMADARFKAKFRKSVPGASDLVEWADECTGRVLWLALGEKKIVQSVTISALGRVSQESAPNCGESLHDTLQTKLWKTGRGLKLGDPRDRIILLYGEPNSSGPSAKGTRELELLLYSFDWAGSDVPQVMEVSCERATGRVVEITLAFPSL